MTRHITAHVCLMIFCVDVFCLELCAHEIDDILQHTATLCVVLQQQCVAMRMLRCVALCCSVVQCADSTPALHRYLSVIHCVALQQQYVAACCSVLQCVTCSVSHRVAVWCSV